MKVGVFMRTVGLVVEYNPFHNGHLYHLEQSKKITNCDYSVAIMSGNFLQRGEPALLDKWTRAKMAVDNGVDLVIELPFIYASRSAEFFSDGAIKILDSLGIVDSLCFGSEVGITHILSDIADILVDEPNLFKSSLKNNLELGLSFPKARSVALVEFFKSNNYGKTDQIENIMSSPNNILAIEYMKSLKKINSKIEPFALQRTSSNYHDKNISGDISSATSIREDFFKNKNLENIKSVIPHSTYKYMESFLEKNISFNSIDNFCEILLYVFRLISYDKLSNVVGVEEGLQNRILKAFNNSNNLEFILNEISTKRYTNTRIKRILIHALIGLDKDTFKKLDSAGPKYIRVLGANANGLKILSKAKATSTLPIITKFSNHKKSNDNLLDEMIDFDKKATDLYFAGMSKFIKNPSMNLDFLTSPYISKK